MEKQVTCPRCNGRGNEYPGEAPACQACGGSGEMTEAAAQAHTEKWKAQRREKAEKFVAFVRAQCRGERG